MKEQDYKAKEKALRAEVAELQELVDKLKKENTYIRTQIEYHVNAIKMAVEHIEDKLILLKL